MHIYSFDKPDGIIYRVRWLDMTEIPVKIDNPKYYDLLESLVSSINFNSKLIKDLDSKLRPKATDNNELFIPETISSPSH
ncbi:9794_t:CDS:2 [Entrophospora sp. SA101]|nr:6551_t:CDS:2 [Entrophospora sp. SA101]CAJ0636451.1 9614_t:CDS:2 [Entrophospora sp. SA101]CAJ0765563.1 9794_t:CDS:2 [Entrophospora sp. SA101]CAJ0835713.1 13152_t:CDS:2 [Entrophospora sp. SA101]CAJ0889052.1 5622_t:CDS:2 [Entrophospora sp. SA101]